MGSKLILTPFSFLIFLGDNMTFEEYLALQEETKNLLNNIFGNYLFVANADKITKELRIPYNSGEDKFTIKMSLPEKLNDKEKTKYNLSFKEICDKFFNWKSKSDNEPNNFSVKEIYLDIDKEFNAIISYIFEKKFVGSEKLWYIKYCISHNYQMYKTFGQDMFHYNQNCLTLAENIQEV
jgi:hypothetical protein